MAENNLKLSCFIAEKDNPYPLCIGRELPICEDCQLRADWEHDEVYGADNEK